jgi:hypothetical protein
MMSQMPPVNFNPGYSGGGGPGQYDGPGGLEAPGATASMIMGILSIVVNVPIAGLIVAYLGFKKAGEAKALIARNPGMYNNAGTAQAGYILCIIGMCLGGISTLCGCGYFIVIVAALMGAAGSGHVGP